jgi:hypothetical protein
MVLLISWYMIFSYISVSSYSKMQIIDIPKVSAEHTKFIIKILIKKKSECFGMLWVPIKYFK